MATTPTGPGIDLFAVFALLGHAGDQHAQTILGKAGYTGFRPSHGPIIRLLLDGPHTVGELAPRLQVTQQAVSKTVRELATHGYVEQLADTADRRRRPVALTARGHEAISLADKVRGEFLDELANTVGADVMQTTTDAVHTMLEHLGLTQPPTRRSGPRARRR
ncbi:MAG: MarR family winged helix-turn-helix transcriptional regulator [Propionibacteriaceae bacterium]